MTQRPTLTFDVLVVVGNDRVSAADRVVDIAFDVNLANDLYISPRVVTASNLRDPVWRATLLVQTLERESVPL